jgi:hypothetical protein
MPNTWLLYWDRPDDKILRRLFENADKKIDEIVKIVEQEKNDLTYRHGPFLLENLLFPFLSVISQKTRYFWLDTAFYSDENSLCKV